MWCSHTNLVIMECQRISTDLHTFSSASWRTTVIRYKVSIIALLANLNQSITTDRVYLTTFCTSVQVVKVSVVALFSCLDDSISAVWQQLAVGGWVASNAGIVLSLYLAPDTPSESIHCGLSGWHSIITRLVWLHHIAISTDHPANRNTSCL